MKKQVAITLRFNADLYRRVKEVSTREGCSINTFVLGAVSRKIAEEEASALYDAFTIVGEDIPEASVEYASDAQREVVLKDE